MGSAGRRCVKSLHGNQSVGAVRRCVKSLRRDRSVGAGLCSRAKHQDGGPMLWRPQHHPPFRLASCRCATRQEPPLLHMVL
jgi:hypothetical protein